MLYNKNLLAEGLRHLGNHADDIVLERVAEVGGQGLASEQERKGE